MHSPTRHRRPVRRTVTGLLAATVLAAPLTLVTAPAQAAAGDDWLHVQGNTIVDSTGKEAVLSGVNWFGFNASERVFHGLWSGNVTEITKQMADRGINVVRVPISTQLLLEWKAGTFLKPNVNTYANPELEGKNSLQIFEYWLTLCQKYGIKVFLDVHSAEADNSGHVYNMWWKGSITTEDVYAGWEWAATRWKDDDTIVGADIKNEPHGTQGSTERAKWDGSTDKDNFKHFAETASKKILAINPNWLVFVEGIEIYPKPGVSWTSTGLTDYYGTWWGGNLRGVRDFPIDLGANQDQLVYSPHDYGPLVFDQKWFQKDFDKASLTADVWGPNWLFIHDEDIAPLLIGEWGGRLGQDPRQDKWMAALRDLIAERRLSQTFWVLNPNSGDTGGLLLDDWKTWDEVKYSTMLKPTLWSHGGKFVGLDHAVPLGGVGSTTGISISQVGSTSDTTAPSVPTGLAAGTPTATTVPLSWSASTDTGGSGVAGYEVYRGSTLVGTTTTTSLTVSGLTADTAYTFTVRAKDGAGNVSAASSAVSVRTAAGTGDTTAPSVPTGVTAGTATTTSVPLTWTASTDTGGSGLAGYDVYRGTTLAGTTTTPSFTATGLTAGTSYAFTVRARDAAGNVSAASTPVTATTASDTPSGSCAVAYTANGWSTGFTASVKVTNTGTSALSGWTLAFDLPAGQALTQGWSAQWSQTGTRVTATNVAWNGVLAAGGSVEIGFSGSHAGSTTAPTAFTVNGATCAVR